MGTQQYVIGNAARTDASAFAVPGDEDGGEGDAAFLVQQDTSRHHRWYVHVENGWDQNVDVTVQGSHLLDTALDAPADDGTAETVNSDTNAAFDGDSGHAYLQINVDPASAPTSGNLTVTFQGREQ